MSAKDTNVGKDTERQVARYLRENGWPGAERRVRTGFRVFGREVADEGDIVGTPFCWQVKSLRPAARAELAVPKWLAETEAQRIVSCAPLGFLVVRRWGTTDVGRWWSFTRLGQLHSMLTGFALDAMAAQPEWQVPALLPVRMDMASLTGLLHQLGWADTAGEEAVS